jgi:hypothetical protein
MPTTPERPDARPDAEDQPSAAEAVPPAYRDTVRIDDAELGRHDTVRVQVRPAAPEHETVPLADNRETVAVPRQRRPERSGRAPLPVAAGFATLWAALLSYLPVAVAFGLVQGAEDTGSVFGAARLGLAAWLLGHGVPLATGIGPIGLTPLLLGGFAAWRLLRAGVHVSRAVGYRRSGRLRDAALVGVAVGIGYGLLGLLAALGAGGVSGVSVPRAALTLAPIGAAFAFVGALRNTDAIRTVARTLPFALRHGSRTGLVAALLILAAGAGIAGLSTAISGGQAAELVAAYRTGVAGQAGITLVSLAYAPNVAIWAAAYLLGPGFAAGTDSTVSLTEVVVGPLPAVPLAGGLPDGPVGGFGAALLVVPVLAAVAAGWLLARRLRRSATAKAQQRTGWWPLTASALIAGPVAGAALAAAAHLSTGPLGDGRLTTVGPVWWQVGAAATAVVTGGVLIGAAATRAFARPSSR